MPDLTSSGSPTFNGDSSVTIDSTGADRVRLPSATLDETTGGLVLRFKTLINGTAMAGLAGGTPVYFEWADDGNNRLIGYYEGDKTFRMFRVSGGAGGTPCAVALDPAAGDKITLAYTWSGTQVKVAVNGGNFTAANDANIPNLAAALVDIAQLNMTRYANADLYWLAAFSGVTLSNTDSAVLHAFGDTDPTWRGLPSGATALWKANDLTYLTSEEVPTGIVGKSTIGQFTTTFGNDFKNVNQYTMRDSGRVTKLSIYLDGLGSGVGAQAFKPVIYADSGGEPGALLASGPEVSIPDNSAAAWHDLALNMPLKVDAGTTIWLGILVGTVANSAQGYYETAGVARRSNPDTYSDGPADPFGVPTISDSVTVSFYATYEVVSESLAVGIVGITGASRLLDSIPNRGMIRLPSAATTQPLAAVQCYPEQTVVGSGFVRQAQPAIEVQGVASFTASASGSVQESLTTPPATVTASAAGTPAITPTSVATSLFSAAASLASTLQGVPASALFSAPMKIELSGTGLGSVAMSAPAPKVEWSAAGRGSFTADAVSRIELDLAASGLVTMGAPGASASFLVAAPATVNMSALGSVLLSLAGLGTVTMEAQSSVEISAAAIGSVEMSMGTPSVAWIIQAPGTVIFDGPPGVTVAMPLEVVLVPANVSMSASGSVLWSGAASGLTTFSGGPNVDVAISVVVFGVAAEVIFSALLALSESVQSPGATSTFSAAASAAEVATAPPASFSADAQGAISHEAVGRGSASFSATATGEWAARTTPASFSADALGTVEHSVASVPTVTFEGTAVASSLTARGVGTVTMSSEGGFEAGFVFPPADVVMSSQSRVALVARSTATVTFPRPTIYATYPGQRRPHFIMRVRDNKPVIESVRPDAVASIESTADSVPTVTRVEG